MDRTAKRLCAIVWLVGLLTTGCGGGSGNVGTSTGDGTGAAVTYTQPTPATSSDLAIAQAMVADPDYAAQLIPTRHHDPLLQATTRQVGERDVQTIPVATLETDYETKFGSLSSRFGVTLSSPHNVDKINFFKSMSATGYFDLLSRPIANNPVGVTGVTFQPVNYQTTVTLPTGQQTFQVSGGLLMPQGVDKTKIRGIVVYFHGTTFDKSAVGSNYAGCTEDQLAAELFASQGYVVIVPDYVGQGVDWQHVHPYVIYPTVTAKTAVDMLAAVKPLITAQYQYGGGDPPMKLFSAGYSEGGAYSLWFNAFISSTPEVLDPFYVLTHSVGMEGAYSTSVVTRGFLFNRVDKGNGNPYNIQTQSMTNLVKPILSADAFLSYAFYSMGATYSNVFSDDYFGLNASLLIPQSWCNVNGQHLNIAQAFAQPDVSCAKPLFFAALDKRANDTRFLGLAEFLTLTSSENNTYSLMSPYMNTEGGQQLLDQTLQAADVNLTPCANGGVSIITLAQDSVVIPNNFDHLLAAYPTKIANAIKIDQNNLMVVSAFSVEWPMWVPADHMQAPIYECIYALNIFNSHAAANQ